MLSLYILYCYKSSLLLSSSEVHVINVIIQTTIVSYQLCVWAFSPWTPYASVAAIGMLHPQVSTPFSIFPCLLPHTPVICIPTIRELSPHTTTLSSSAKLLILTPGNCLQKLWLQQRAVFFEELKPIRLHYGCTKPLDNQSLNKEKTSTSKIKKRDFFK